jgi:hypothetical protein
MFYMLKIYFWATYKTVSQIWPGPGRNMLQRKQVVIVGSDLGQWCHSPSSPHAASRDKYKNHRMADQAGRALVCPFAAQAWPGRASAATCSSSSPTPYLPNCSCCFFQVGEGGRLAFPLRDRQRRGWCESDPTSTLLEKCGGWGGRFKVNHLPMYACMYTYS